MSTTNFKICWSGTDNTTALEKDHSTSLLLNNTVALRINIFIIIIIIIIIIICYYYRHKMQRFKICDPHSCLVREFTCKKYSRPCPSHEDIKEE
jgi:hypothetical protein